MIKWLLLLIVIGLAFTGWHYRDKISAWLPSASSKGVVEVLSGAVTPHPAVDSRLKAVKTYPALGVQGSAFNIKFVQLFNQIKDTDPNFLAQADWPMQLAQRTALELGGPLAGIPTPMPPPGQASGSVLNERPLGQVGAATVRPAVQLPGFQGSALDQRPPPKGR